MERYKVSWIPSQSSFVEKRQLIGRINGTEAVLVDNLPSSANQVLYDFPTAAPCEIWTRVFGDNGTQADSTHLNFTAANHEQVQPDSAVMVEWTQHIP